MLLQDACAANSAELVFLSSFSFHFSLTSLSFSLISASFQSGLSHFSLAFILGKRFILVSFLLVSALV